MKKLYFFLLLSLCLAGNGWGQTTFTWNFGASAGTATVTAGSNPNITVGDLSIGNSLGTVATWLTNGTASSGYAGASGSYNAGNAARTGALNTGTSGSAYFEFTISPASGYTILLSSFSFGTRSTGTAPQAYSLRSSSDSYASDISTGVISANSTWALKSNSTLVYNFTAPTTFRLYGYNGAGSPGSGTINWKIDDLSIILTATASTGNNAPSVSSPTATSITLNSAILGGNIISNGGAAITERGTVWSTSTGVTITDNKLAEGGTDIGIFTQNRTDLPVGTTIYYKAYATNSVGTTLSSEGSFTTLYVEPTNHPTAFSSSVTTPVSITTSWTDAAGGQLPTGYLIKAAANGTPVAPVDGVPEVNSTLVKNVNQGVGSVVFTGLNTATSYTFTIWPYTNSGSGIDYKPDGPSTTISTPVVEIPAPGDLIITQFNPAYGGASDEYVEILNKTNKTFDLSLLKIEYQSSTGSSGGAGGVLSGSIGPYEYWLLSPNTTITVGQTTGLSRDGIIASGFAASAGQLALKLNFAPGTRIDGLAYGTVSPNNLGEGTAAATPSSGLSRTIDATDTDNNSTDFTTVATTNIYLRNHNSMNVTSDYSINRVSFSDLVISNDATGTLTSDATVTSKLIITPTSDLVVSNGRSLITTGTVTGSANVVKNITGNAEAWHLLSSPVAAQSISGDFTPAGTYGDGTGYDFYGYDEITSTWMNQKVGINNITSFVPGQGYLVAYQASGPVKTFTGTLNTGNITLPLTVSGSGDYAGYNLAGNPYPSSIDWKAASGWSRSMLESNGGGYDMYVWNDTAANYGVYNSASVSDLGTNSVQRYIAPMQGFFVRAASAGSLGMDNAIRVHNNASGWLKNTQETNTISLTVESASYGKDEVMIEYGHVSAEGGAGKMFSFVETAPSLYIVKNGKDYSVSFLDAVEDNPLIPVSFSAGSNGNYVIYASMGSSSFGSVKLEDKLTGTMHDLLANPSYSFTASVSDSPDRFKLHFTTLGIADPQKASNVKVYSADHTIYISGNVDGSRVVVTTITGQVVLKAAANQGVTALTAGSLPKGIYLVTVFDKTGAVTGKVVL